MDELLTKLKKNFSDEEFAELKAAYDFSKDAHKDQKRQTGEPYFIHPCAVVNILVDLGFDDVSTVGAAFPIRRRTAFTRAMTSLVSNGLTT